MGPRVQGSSEEGVLDPPTRGTGTEVLGSSNFGSAQNGVRTPGPREEGVWSPGPVFQGGQSEVEGVLPGRSGRRREVNTDGKDRSRGLREPTTPGILRRGTYWPRQPPPVHSFDPGEGMGPRVTPAEVRRHQPPTGLSGPLKRPHWAPERRGHFLLLWKL